MVRKLCFYAANSTLSTEVGWHTFFLLCLVTKVILTSVSQPLGKSKYFIPEVYLEEAGSCGESLSSSTLFIILYLQRLT